MALAAMMICLGASAIDKVVKKSEMKEEVTSVADLANATFMLQSGTGEEAVVLYTPSGWDIKVAPMVTAIAKQDNGGFFKLEALGDHYLIPVFNINKERRTFWSGNQYVNAQPTGNVIFGLAGTNDQHGQDGENLAVWDIAYTEGQGFTFHCYGRDVYIGYDAEAARPSTTPVYWRAYKSYIAGYDVDEVTAAYEAVAAAVKTTAAATALSEAKTAYDSDNDLDKFGDAVNAAIDVVNACVAINATYTNLDTYGAAIATEVLAKYNVGEYANAEELRAAYIVAAKAQRTAGADFTGAIINPGFEYGNTDGWTTVASADTGARETSNGTYAATGSEGNYLFNTWWKGTPCTQTIAGLPNGTYKLSALVASDGATIYLTANGGHNEGTETGGEHPSSGVFQTAEYEFAVTDGTATIGVVGGADGTAGEHKDYVAEGYWWYKADNFKLTLVELAPEAPTTYAITIAEGIENGSIEADVAEAAEGTKVTLTIEPADGYELDELSVKNGEDDVEVAEDYTFTMPAAAVTVSATFKEAAVAPTTYAITIAEGLTNGSVEATPATAAEGETVKLTITPADGYELKSISISYGEDEDAKTIEPDEENSFIMPAAPVVIDAVFSEIIPDIVLNAPTFNAEEGTQAEPNMLPEGSTLKINYTAENLEANGLTADDVKVKVTVMVSGDLPEAGMSMGSTTAHRVMGETFYIPLGETDFPVALKPGYVYQNVAVMAAELVKPATDTEKEETLAAVGAPVQLHWVGIYDDLLIEIAQDQGKSLDDFPRTEFVEGDDYNTYTCTEGIQVAFKMFDIDVKDCDYVIVKFAEPVAAGWELAFWAHNDQSTVAVPAGATEYKYVFADDTKCAIQNGILPQICMLRLWSGTPPLEAKVTGVYKHYLGNEVAQEINVERYPGMGYTATEATVDFALAKRVLGVKEVTSDMLRIVNPDNTEISDCAQYDGWFNAEGVAEAWNASTTKVCAKFFQAIPNGTFEICDMNGADEVGKTYSVKWALVANDKKVVYTINVTFVEKPAIALTFDDLNVVDEKAADFSFKLGTSYQSEKATVDVAAILDKLEVESLSDVTIYAVQSDGSLDDNYKLGTTDGWRNAAGDWQGWGADAFFYVKANFAATENQLYDVGTMDPTQNTTIEAGTFTAKYAFVKGNDTHDAVVLSVNVALVDPVGINSIEIAKAKGNGKYLDKKGHIIIVNDNKAFSLSGAEMK